MRKFVQKRFEKVSLEFHICVYQHIYIYIYRYISSLFQHLPRTYTRNNFYTAGKELVKLNLKGGFNIRKLIAYFLAGVLVYFLIMTIYNMYF